MTVGILAPMPSELKPITKALGLVRDGAVHRGRAGLIDVVAMQTGIGTAAARATAERMVALDGIERVVVVGIAGGVDDRYEIGDVFQPEVVIDGATGAEYRPEPLGTHAPHEGRLWTSDEFSTDPDAVGKLAATGITALDMETAAIGAVCEARGCAWSVFRSISDRVSDGIVDQDVFLLVNPDGSPNLGKAARYVARKPWRVPLLVRVGRDATKAANAAAREAIRAISG
jgi:adenosylhomocysteine nucleosidase